MAVETRSLMEKFDGSNFSLWKLQIEDVLYQKKLYQPLAGLAGKPKEMSEDEWQVLDRTALGTVRLSLAPSVAFNIVHEKTTRDLMAALSKMYEAPSASNKVFLMKNLFNMRLNDGGSVASHLNSFNTLTSQLGTVGIVFDDEVRALLALSSLPDSWSGFVTAVSNSSGNKMLKFDDMVGQILNEEVRRRANAESSSTGSALHVGQAWRSGGSMDKNRKPVKSKKGTEVVCWRCGLTGHFKRDCPNAKKEERQESSSNLVDRYPQEALVMSSQSLDSFL